MFTFIIVVIMAAGLLIGYYIFPRFSAPAILTAVQSAQKYATFFLLFAMGIWLGGNEEFWGQLQIIGLRGIILAVSATLFSILGVWAVGKVAVTKTAAPDPENGFEPGLLVPIKNDVAGDAVKKSGAVMLGPIVSLITGALFGRFLFPAALAGWIDPVITIALGVVVFCAGIDIGEKRIIMRKLKEYKGRVLLFPAAVAIGSIAGGFIAGGFLGIPARDCVSVAAGMGYYSLTSGILTGLGGPGLGSLAFTVNVLREALALLFIPLIARHIGFHAAIAPAGAASMDTALGVIARSTDEETALISMINGVVLTVAVPVLVPLLYRLL
ncbi:MAG: lysine exporter LysO family protein [Oscillospiraceae bacterium]|nr:lysine exporter LysO family protein [Oscillospiraceae bacterium]